MSTDENKAVVRRFVEAVINQQQLEVIDELVAADFIEHDALPPDIPPGSAGQKRYMAMFLHAFPDLHIAVKQAVAEGDTVVFYQTLRGTHRGAFMGLAPTGKAVAFDATDIVRVEDGKMAEHWSVMDTLGLLQQLGAVLELGQ